jgi:A/G-specific adenine glycosylase
VSLRSRDISRLLIAWYRRERRDLPWRRTSDPYRVWVSEIMLQQTRAQAAIPYYERFLRRFPTVEALASAEEEEVLALWSGLGYYARARNLLRAAQRIAAAGAFPRDYESIRALPGVGGYTAAAIASIAFGLPHAVVDGNVMRVVARVRNDPAEIGAARTRERFRSIAQDWLDARRAGTFNQALMELGATVCLPKNPRCAACPLEALCAARAAGTAVSLPVKLRKREPVRVEEALLVVRRGGRILLRREAAGAARMAGFWTLPSPGDLPEARVGARLGQFRHSITHHRYVFTVYAARLGPAGFKSEPAFEAETRRRGGKKADQEVRPTRGPALRPGAGLAAPRVESGPRPSGSGLQPAAGGSSPRFQWFAPAGLAAIPIGAAGRKGLKVAGIE